MRVPIRNFVSLEVWDNQLRYRLGLPVRKKAKQIPFMYYEIEGSDWLEICEETWKKFLEAFEMVQEYSYAEVANWLTYHAPQPISASQLRNVVQHRPPLMDIRYADRETREKFYKRTLESFINGYSKDSGETDEGQTES